MSSRSGKRAVAAAPANLERNKAGAKKSKPMPKPQNIEETIISKYKRKEYLDNYQYKETTDLKKKTTSSSYPY